MLYFPWMSLPPSSLLLLKFLEQGRERLTPLLHLHFICSSLTLFNKGMNDHLALFLGLGIGIFQAGIISFLMWIIHMPLLW